MTTRGSRTNSKCFEMKRLYFILLGLFVFCSCQSLFIEDRAGQVIRFGASMHNGNLTRTHYSNYVDPDTKKERIEWVDGDDVTVYMYWELQPGSSQASPDPEATHSFDYYVTDPYNLGEHKYIHRGKLSPKGNGKPLTWKGSANENVRFNHYFYSTYPAGYSELSYVDPSDVELIFDLPQNEGEMCYAYMAAAAQSVSTRDDNNYEDAVDLDYYPMVTTLHIFLNNQSSTTDGTISVTISNTNELKPLFGKYTASLDNDNKFVAKDGKTNEENSAINEVSKSFTLYAEESDDFLLFIRPHDYDTGEVTLTINNVTWDLPHLKPCYKYNILVNVDDNNGTLEPDPNDPDDFQLGALQIFADLIRDNGGPNFGGQNGIWGKLKEYYKNNTKYIGDQWDEQGNNFNNYLWPKFLAIFNDFDNLTMDALKDIFGEGAIDILLEAVKQLENVILTDANITGSVPASDLQKLIPNVKHLSIQYPNMDGVNFEIDGLPYLETLKVMHANGTFSVKNCPNLSSIDLQNADNNTIYEFENVGLKSFTGEKGKSYSFKNCPDLANVSFNNLESNFEGASFDNCGLTSFSQNGANAVNAKYEFANMDYLETIYVERAASITARNCKVLRSISFSSNYAGPVIETENCPNYQ